VTSGPHFAAPVNQIRTHYDNLKVSRDAPPEVIRMAYKALVTKHHPDRNPGSEQSLRTMQAINDSYEILMDDEKRRLHDQWIADQERLAPVSSMAMQPDRAEETDALRAKARRPARSGCGCLGLASFLSAILFIVFAVAATLTAPSPSSAGKSGDRENPRIASENSAAASSHGHEANLPGPWNERVVNVHWNGRQYPVRADKMVAIRKKVDVASWYVSEYLKLREEKDSLEKRLESSLAGREQLQQKIAETDARMDALNASGMKVMGEVEAEIRGSAP